jgi:hypothetical protein
MNFAMHFATPVANFILVIGRLLAVKSVVGICDEGETTSTQTGWVLLFTFEFQGKHPTNLEERPISEVSGAYMQNHSHVI